MFLSQEEQYLLSNLGSDEVTTRQAKEILGTTRQTLHNIRKEGALPYRKLSARIIAYKRADVERVLAEREVQLRQRQRGQDKYFDRLEGGLSG